MLDSTSVNSSGEFGTSGLFSAVPRREFICRCCGVHYHGNLTAWEFRTGDWVCKLCVPVIEALIEAGESRGTKAFAFLTATVSVRTRWDA